MLQTTRVLIASNQPRPGDYTGICLLCLLSYTVTFDTYPTLGQWARDHTCTPNAPPAARCLYCDSTDVYETHVTVDEHHGEHALQCGDCGGLWAP